MGFLPAALAIAGPVMQGVGGLLAGQSNKKRAFAQAKEEMRASGEEEREVRAAARKQIGEQLAAQFSNGMMGGSGSAIDAIRESQLNAALDARELRRRGLSKSDALKSQGRAAMREGYFALAGGMLGAATGAMKQGSDWAQARSGTSGGGGKG